MIKELPVEAEEQYLHSLIGRLFKLLPIQEEGNQANFLAYAQALQRELNGCESIMSRIAYDRDWVSILAILANIINGDLAFPVFRRDVFRMTSLCQKLISHHFYGGLDDE